MAGSKIDPLALSAALRRLLTSLLFILLLGLCLGSARSDLGTEVLDLGETLRARARALGNGHG